MSEQPIAKGAGEMPVPFAALHADARRTLAAWRAPTSGLEETRQRMIAVLEADPTAMWRSHSHVHFTASLVVLSPDLDAVALTLHGKAKRWFQFGGHFESSDASLALAALREGTEESGLGDLVLLPQLIQVDAHELSSAFGHCREHLDLRFAARATSTQLTRSDESDEVAWWPLDALPDDTEASLREAISLAQVALATAGACGE